MKVLQIGKFYPPYRGGMETHLQSLATGLSRYVDLQVIVANDTRDTVDEIVDGVRLCRLGSWARIAATSICPEMVTRIRSTPADIVHIHWPNPFAVAAFLASGHTGRLIITYHSDVIRQKTLFKLFGPMLNAALRRCDAIIATSTNYISTSPVLKLREAKCSVLPFAVPDAAFEVPEAAKIEAIRRQYGSRIVLAVGRLVYYKGFEFLIRAMADVSGILLIIGEGSLRDSLERLIRECNLSERAFILKRINDIQLRAYYAASDVFVLPSIARSEAFGLVQAEAMAAGKPVINTDLPSGVPSVSLHQVTGLTVQPADTVGLRTAIATLLDNHNLREAYGRAARSRADRDFRSSHMVDRTLSLYTTVVQQSKRRMAAAV